MTRDAFPQIEDGFRFARLFSSNLDSGIQAKVAALQSLPSSASSALLAGPSRSGKTTLLFQYAHNHLLEHPQDIALLILKKSKLENKPPLLPQGVSKTSPAYERMQIRFLNSEQEVRQYLACIHLLQSLPSLIILDDFADFFADQRLGDHGPPARNRELAFAKTLALLHDASCFIRQARRSACTILLSDTHVRDMSRHLYLYQRWIPLLVKIRAGDGNSFSAAMSDPVVGVDVCASYSLTSTSFVLNELEQMQRSDGDAARTWPIESTQGLSTRPLIPVI